MQNTFVYGDSISMQWGIPFSHMIEHLGYRYSRLGG